MTRRVRTDLVALRSRVSIHDLARQCVLRHQASEITLCPLGQPNKAVGLESPIEPYGCHCNQCLACVAPNPDEAVLTCHDDEWNNRAWACCCAAHPFKTVRHGTKGLDATRVERLPVRGRRI